MSRAVITTSKRNMTEFSKPAVVATVKTPTVKAVVQQPVKKTEPLAGRLMFLKWKMDESFIDAVRAQTPKEYHACLKVFRQWAKSFDSTMKYCGKM